MERGGGIFGGCFSSGADLGLGLAFAEAAVSDDDAACREDVDFARLAFGSSLRPRERACFFGLLSLGTAGSGGGFGRFCFGCVLVLAAA